MRRRTETWIREWWDGGGGVVGRVADVATAPLERLYRSVVGFRARRWRGRGVVVPGIAVVSVGNLRVGGTGKTPLAAWIVTILQEAGQRVALVARGYGEDEVALHRLWNPGAPVFTDSNRVEAVRAAVAAGCTVAVADDAFQHLRLARNLDVVLVAAEDAWTSRLLPRGPFREATDALGRADVVVVTARTASEDRVEAVLAEIRATAPEALVAAGRFVTDGWVGLDRGPLSAPSDSVLAVTSVARPETFRAQTEASTGARVELAAFPDHHVFGARDVEDILDRSGGRTVVVTEKDAVKLRQFSDRLGRVAVARQRFAWTRGGDAFVDRLLRAAEASG